MSKKNKRRSTSGPGSANFRSEYDRDVRYAGNRKQATALRDLGIPTVLDPRVAAVVAQGENNIGGSRQLTAAEAFDMLNPTARRGGAGAGVSGLTSLLGGAQASPARGGLEDVIRAAVNGPANAGNQAGPSAVFSPEEAKNASKYGGFGGLSRLRNAATQGLTPIADEEAPSELDQLLATLGGAPDRGAYMRPYDEAEQRANAAYQAAGPEIAANFDRLRQQVGQGASDADARQAQILAAVSADQNAARSTIEGLQGATTRDLQAQSAGLTPSLEGAASVTANQNIANLLAQGQAQKTMLGNVGNAEDQSIASRKLDADAAQAAASSNARTNLDSILGQIGVGRAGAERQFQGDVQNRAADEAKLRMQYHQDELETLEKQQKKTDEVLKQLDKVSTTPHDDFMSGYVTRAAKYPKSMEVFESITSAAKGKGEQGLSQALRLLDTMSKDLQRGVLVDADGNETPLGARPDPKVLAGWLAAYYDQKTKRPNTDALAQLGIDPSALGL